MDNDEECDLNSIEENSIEGLIKMNLLKRENIVNCHTFDIGPVYPGYFIDMNMSYLKLWLF